MTKQISDTLIYKDKEYYLNNEILEYYFRKFPDKKPEIKGVMTACWRGYIATFEILNNELKIKEIDWLIFGNQSVNDEVYPFSNGDTYSWFSGFIRIDLFRGEFDDEKDENGIYELLEIREGNLVEHWKFTYSEFLEFKEVLFSLFIETEDYKKLFKQWEERNPGITKERINQLIFDRIVSNVRKI